MGAAPQFRAERHRALFCSRTWTVASICIFLLLSLYGCDHSDKESPAPEQQSQRQDTAPPKEEKKPPRRSKSRDYDFKNYIETGDLNALKKRGIIRFIGLDVNEDDVLPRSSVITMRHFDMAMALADHLGLEPHWIQANTPEHALELLREGKADVLAGNLTRTEKRETDFSLSHTITTSKQVLVTGENSAGIKVIGDLKGHTLSVLEGSTYADTARELQKKIPDLKLNFWEIHLSDNLDRIFDKLNQQKDVVTIMDSNVLDNVIKYRQDFQIGAQLSDTEDVVWAMRKDAPDLKKQLNNFLTRKLVATPDRTASDWNSIKESRVLRLLTYNGPTSYFMWQGVLMGFDYDLARKFAKKNDLELQVIVVPYEEDLIDWLKAGKGDFAGATTTITNERKQQGVEFTTPYLEMPEQIISRSKSPKIETLEDLNGRTLTLRAFSSFIETAKSLQKRGIDVKIKIADPETSYAQLANMVAEGEIEATIVDGGAAKMASSLRDSISAGAIITEPRSQGWMVTSGNKKLLENLNKFIEKYRNTEAYATQVKTYFEPNQRFTKKLAARIRPGENISPYDDLVKKAAEKFDFDWLLVMAQMWQESSFNPKAESPVGAQGLLQVMPRTAEEMGYPPPLFDPERGVTAGVKYMKWLRDRFDPEVDLQNRLWLSLAAYNAGIGHVYDAQRLAE